MRSIASFVALALGLSGCAKHLPPTMVPADVLEYRTSDGWSGDIRHYPPSGPSNGAPPVLLVHGMGANHYNWDFRPEVSLAAHLQERGWDVWIPELRGDPGSRAPSKKILKNYSFDDIAVYDMPAAVDAVLARTGDDQLYWVGHSMGGMLLYTALSEYPEKIAGGVAICSPSTLQTIPFLHRQVRTFGGLAGKRGSINQKFAIRLMRPLGRTNPLYGRVAYRKNLDYPIANGLARVALLDRMPRPMLHQAVQWLRAGEIVRTDGSPWITPTETAVPLLAMGASKDRIVPMENVRHTCDVFSDCTWRELSPEGGFSVDYGHVDPVLGSTAASEIYPVISDFLSDIEISRK